MKIKEKVELKLEPPFIGKCVKTRFGEACATLYSALPLEELGNAEGRWLAVALPDETVYYALLRGEEASSLPGVFKYFAAVLADVYFENADIAVEDAVVAEMDDGRLLAVLFTEPESEAEARELAARAATLAAEAMSKLVAAFQEGSQQSVDTREKRTPSSVLSMHL